MQRLRSTRARRTLLGLAGMLLLVSCGGTRASTPTQSADDPGGTIEPRPDLDTSRPCTVPFGEARVNALFYAINRGDAAGVQATFPHSGTWEFTLSPAMAAAISSGVGSKEESSVSSPGDVPRFLTQLTGLHFVFAAELSGNVVETTGSLGKGHEIAIGPILWRATGSPLQERGKSRVFGGGKATISCDTGLFRRVLLSPLKIS